MNSVNSHKYGYALNVIEEKAVEMEKFRDIYDFYRLVKVRQHAERCEHADVKKDKKLHKKLRQPLKIGEKVLALAEPDNLYKSTAEHLIFQPRAAIRREKNC